jgi:hypothetical protein
VMIQVVKQRFSIYLPKMKKFLASVPCTKDYVISYHFNC